MIVLRPYQEACKDALRDGYRRGLRRQVLCAPTGSGKTEIAMSILQDARAKGTRVAFVCDRLVLVDQTSTRLAGAGIPHGVIQAGQTYGAGEPIVVCSSQTIERRGFPGSGFVIVDECHTQRVAMSRYLRTNEVQALGLSATPIARGMAETWQGVVNVTTTNQLIRDEYLVPVKVYAATEIDLNGLPVNSQGEWGISDIAKRTRVIVGDVVSDWKRHTQAVFGGPVKTLVFTASVQEGEQIAREFREQGFQFRQVSYKDGNDAERAETIEAFRRNELRGLISCEVLIKGADFPDVLCLVDARPYRKSLASYIQMLGRVMRPSPLKEFGLVLDHSGNYEGFYDDLQEFFDAGCPELFSKEKKQEARKPKQFDRACPRCAFMRPTGVKICPSCGYESQGRVGNEVEHRPGRMTQIDTIDGGVNGAASLPPRRDLWAMLCTIAAESKGADDDFTIRRRAAGSFKDFTKQWPSRKWEVEYMPPTEAVRRKQRGYLQRYFVRFRKGREKSP